MAHRLSPDLKDSTGVLSIDYTSAMHEWALAEAVVATAKRAAHEQHLPKVTAITVKLGELQQIEREIFYVRARANSKPRRRAAAPRQGHSRDGTREVSLSRL
jgi:hypothetical protein